MSMMGKTSKKQHRKKRQRSSSYERPPPNPSVSKGFSVQSKGECITSASPNNPLLEKFQSFLVSTTQMERDNFFSNAHLDPSRRAELWMKQADIGEDLVNRYSWAIPDERAIRIIKQFSPIIEIGCGANAYWCKLMMQAGIDVVGYDVNLDDGGKISASTKDSDDKQEESRGNFYPQKGGPEVLASKEIRDANRTLFLCYTDEDNVIFEEQDEEQEGPLCTLGSECLQYYDGQYIIHVGELYGDTASADQAPWGRSSSPEFQQQLAAQFHCLLRAKLPNWLHVNDTISVWKRSETCSIVFSADEEDTNEVGEEVEYKQIPVAERLPTDIAAPCLLHLLHEK